MSAEKMVGAGSSKRLSCAVHNAHHARDRMSAAREVDKFSQGQVYCAT